MERQHSADLRRSGIVRWATVMTAAAVLAAAPFSLDSTTFLPFDKAAFANGGGGGGGGNGGGGGGGDGSGGNGGGGGGGGGSGGSGGADSPGGPDSPGAGASGAGAAGEPGAAGAPGLGGTAPGQARGFEAGPAGFGPEASRGAALGDTARDRDRTQTQTQTQTQTRTRTRERTALDSLTDTLGVDVTNIEAGLIGSGWSNPEGPATSPEAPPGP